MSKVLMSTLASDLNKELPHRGIFLRAKLLAYKVHEHQLRWDGTPSIGHISGVHDLVVRNCVVLGIPLDDPIRAATWLHDSVEDTDLTLDDIESLLNPEIRSLVDLLTRRPQEKYLADYIPRVASHPSTRLIKKCDLIYNLSTLPFEHNLVCRYIPALNYIMTRNM